MKFTVPLLIAICLIASGCVTVCHGQQKPNILWIVAEDMGPELACYGTAQVKTPALDRLAERGMLFENAFTVTGVCSTSRSSFMTGMYAMSIDAHNHRSHRNGGNPLPDGVRVLTDWLRPAGYTTGNLRHLADDAELRRFYKGTGKTDWNFAYPEGQRPFDTDRWDALIGDAPFFAQINFSETHRGGAWNNAHQHIEQTADPELVEIPPYYPDHPVTRAVWAQYLNTVMCVDKKVEFILERLKQAGMERNTVVIFMADHGRAMPRGKQWPYDSGMHIPLIVYWPEDNPDLPEPAGYQRGSRSNQLVSSIDVSASILDFAGLEKPERMQGRVLFGEHRDAPRAYLFGGRDRGDETVFHIRTVRSHRYRYLRNAYPDRPFLQLNRYKERQYPIIGLMRWLDQRGELSGPAAVLMSDSRPAEELYDIVNDPWEIHNLADDPKFAEVKADLKQRLDRWQDEIGDRGRTPEPAEVVRHWEEEMKKSYDEALSKRPANWFFSHPALGPYARDLPADR